jgi:hypothetical protein
VAEYTQKEAAKHILIRIMQLKISIAKTINEINLFGFIALHQKSDFVNRD